MIVSLFHRIKLFSNKRKEFYLFLKDITGFYPGKTRLYDIAFIHKSASSTDSMGNYINNERLEYLGDAILGAVVAEFLYNRFPQRGEGFLTQMRSKLVNRAFLTQLMHNLGLNQFVSYRKIGNTSTSNIYGDALEAFIGAMYLDKGYNTTKHVIIKRFLSEYVDLAKVEESDNNFKSQLIEWSQKNKQEIKFETTGDNSANNKNKFFVSIVEIDNVQKGKGYGGSKKEAQQNAARDALKNIETDESQIS